MLSCIGILVCLSPYLLTCTAISSLPSSSLPSPEPLFLSKTKLIKLAQVRSIFRTIELGEGYAGYLATHEVYFYTLDTLPLFIAISIFVPFWPGRFIREESSVVENVRQDKESTDSAAVGEKEGAVVGEKEVVGR